LRLRIFLPAVDRPEATTAYSWILFDARRTVLREGTSVLPDVPRAEEVEAVLPAERVLFARLKLPRVNAATIRELLPYAVEDRLLADPSQIHAVAGRTTAGGETIVVVVDREWLLAMIAALVRQGLRPKRAWAESDLLAGGQGDWNLVWSPERGMLVDDDGVAATFDHGATGELPLALRLALDESSARGQRPTRVRVHTQGSAAIPDLARWTADTEIAFAPGTQWQVLARGDCVEKAIDLLHGDFSMRARGMQTLPRAAVVLAAAIAVAQLGFVAADAWRLERERSALEAERETVFRDAFPDAKVVVDPDLQMQRNLADLKRSRGLPAGDGFLGRLSRAAHEPGAPAKSIEYANGTLKVTR
jgi:general secretion pathway protein L